MGDRAIHVWVIVALDDDGVVKQCVVWEDEAESASIFQMFKQTYGGRNVAFISRELNDPSTLTPDQKGRLEFFRSRVRKGG